MEIQKIKIFRYQLPFVQPVMLREEKQYFRQGLIVRVTGNGGIQAYGEIAPLPGFSLETLEESEEQLIALAQSLLHQSIPEEVTLLEGAFHRWLNQPEMVSSVKFGIQMAILNLLSGFGQSFGVRERTSGGY